MFVPRGGRGSERIRRNPEQEGENTRGGDRGGGRGEDGERPQQRDHLEKIEPFILDRNTKTKVKV